MILPGRGADRLHPSQPAKTSCRWYGFPVARYAGQAGELQEPHVRGLRQHRGRSGGDVDAAVVQGVPCPAHVVPDLQPDAADHVVPREVGTGGGAVVVDGLEGAGALHLGAQGSVPARPRDREAGGTERGGGGGGGIAVEFGGEQAGQVADVLLQLEGGGVRIEVQHRVRVGTEWECPADQALDETARKCPREASHHVRGGARRVTS